MNIKIVIATSLVVLVVLTTFVSGSLSVQAAESPNILFGRDLSVGSSGQDVVVLQGLLSEMGYLTVPAGVPFGYFGALTQAAVSRYQASQNVTPTAGYYGPVSRLAMRTHFASRGWLSLLGW